MIIFVVLPTFNEAENIVRLIPQLLELPVQLNVLVVDDNSPDGSGALADEFAVQHPGRVEVIHRSGKLGLGTAYLTGFQQALKLGADFILTMDADFSHQPHYIPEMFTLVTKTDLVIGSRYIPGGRAVDSPFLRQVLSRMANLTAHLMLGLKTRDVTAGFRIYRCTALQHIPLNQIFSSGYFFLIELLFQIERRGWHVAEFPILFHDRKLGQSKISRNEIFKDLYTVIRLTLRRLKDAIENI